MAAVPDRATLRKIFDKFDEDKSGEVSVHEMKAMCRALQLNKTDEEIKQLVKESDPNGNGSIDFEEFATALAKQMSSGGGLADIFGGAADFFGFLNPFKMFGGGDPAPAAPAAAAVPASRTASPPAASASPPVASPETFPAAAQPTAAPPPQQPIQSYDTVEGRTPDGIGASLFERYSASPGKKVGHQWTRTVRLRSNGLKLSCYINERVNFSRATVISLPEECDTIAEVMPKIQQMMQLDKELKYAAELYNPDGSKITSWKELETAARKDTAIVVGCGEPFDHNTMPWDILEFYKQGGGRKAAKIVKHMLQDKRKEEALEKADTVRASGHGLTPVAVITSRNENVELNRQQANIQRHEYMEQLMYRAAQEKELMDRVQQNNAMHKLEQEEAKIRKKEYERERFEMLAYQRELQKAEAERRKAEMDEKMRTMHNKVKSDFENSAFYKKSKRLANISRGGSSKKVSV